MGSGFSKMRKQAKQFEQQLSQMQSELQAKEIQGQAAGGLVKITLSGDKQLKKIKIDPKCVDTQDISALEDLIIGAFEDAEKKLSESNPSLQGLNLPF